MSDTGTIAARAGDMALRRVALIAEDHDVYRLGLANVLERRCGFAKVLQASSLDEAVAIVGEAEGLDLATFDLSMPGMHGAASLGAVRQTCPLLRTVVVSASERREDILAALTAGAHGYATKSMGMDALVEAVETVMSGRIFLPWSVAELPADGSTDRPAPASMHDRTSPKLTARQRDVLRLLKGKHTNKQIARELGLTENTVKVHTVSLYRALGIRGRGEVNLDDVHVT